MSTWNYEALKKFISLITVASTHTINHAYLQIHLALLPVFMIEFKLGLSTIGMIISIATLCQVLATIPGGMIADKLGSVKVILLSLLLTLIGALIMSQTFNVYMLILGISIITLSTAIYHPPAYSLVSRLVAPNSRGKALGIHGGAGDIGLALGPITAGILLSYYGWRFVYLVWLIPMLLSVIILLRVKPSTHSVEKEFTVINKKIKFITGDFLTLALITYLLIISLRAVGMQTVSTILSPFLVFGRNIPKDTASILFGLMPLMGGITAPIGGYFTDKIGAKRLFAFSLFITPLTLLGIIYSNSVVFIITFILLYGAFNYTAMAATASLLAQLTPVKRRGMGYALFFLPSYVANTIAPAIAGYVGQNYGLENTFFIAISSYLIGLILLLTIMPKGYYKAHNGTSD